MEGAVLAGAHLEGADLSEARSFTLGQIAIAHCYTKEKLPDDLRKLEDLPDKPHGD